jgi:hypothetical protein
LNNELWKGSDHTINYLGEEDGKDGKKERYESRQRQRPYVVKECVFEVGQIIFVRRGSIGALGGETRGCGRSGVAQIRLNKEE